MHGDLWIPNRVYEADTVSVHPEGRGEPTENADLHARVIQGQTQCLFVLVNTDY